MKLHTTLSYCRAGIAVLCITQFLIMLEGSVTTWFLVPALALVLIAAVAWIFRERD